MLFWACCAVQVLLLSLSKTSWRNDLTEELNILFLNYFFFPAWISSLVELTPRMPVLGAEQGPGIDPARAPHPFGDTSSLPALNRTLFLTQQGSLVTMQRLLD